MSQTNELTNKALAILREFVQDVEAVGRKQVGHEWPDLFITFNKAERLLIGVGTGKYSEHGNAHGKTLLPGGGDFRK